MTESNLYNERQAEEGIRQGEWRYLETTLILTTGRMGLKRQRYAAPNGFVYCVDIARNGTVHAVRPSTRDDITTTL